VVRPTEGSLGIKGIVALSVRLALLAEHCHKICLVAPISIYD